MHPRPQILAGVQLSLHVAQLGIPLLPSLVVYKKSTTPPELACECSALLGLELGPLRSGFVALTTGPQRSNNCGHPTRLRTYIYFANYTLLHTIATHLLAYSTLPALQRQYYTFCICPHCFFTKGSQYHS